MWPGALKKPPATILRALAYIPNGLGPGYYHWKVAELNQLQHCPHLQGLPVPLGPMECPSELQQLQRPNQSGASALGASGRSGVGGQMTSGSSGEPSPMIGEAGDSPSWYDRVTHEEAKKGACKRKRTDTEQLAPGHPFPLGPKSDRKEAMDAIVMTDNIMSDSHLGENIN